MAISTAIGIPDLLAKARRARRLLLCLGIVAASCSTERAVAPTSGESTATTEATTTTEASTSSTTPTQVDPNASAFSASIAAGLQWIPAPEPFELELSVDFLDTVRATTWRDAPAVEGRPPEYRQHVSPQGDAFRYILPASGQSFGWTSPGNRTHRDEFGYGFDETSLVIHEWRSGSYAAVGTFDSDAVEEAISTSPGWSEVLDEGTHQGYRYWNWGQQAPDLPLGVRGLIPGELLLDGPVAVRTRFTTMVETIDAHEDGTSLASNERLAAMIERLHREKFLTSTITDANYSSVNPLVVLEVRSHDELLEQLEQDAQLPALHPYVLLAAGTVDGGDRPIAALVIDNFSVELAQDNVERLLSSLATRTVRNEGEVLWIEVLGEPEITVDGTVITAHFPLADSPSRTLGALRDVDSLFGVA